VGREGSRPELFAALGCHLGNTQEVTVADVLPTVLVLAMLAVMAAKTAGPFGVQPDGKILLEVPVRLMFRLLNHRVNLIAILAVLILGSGLIGDRWISHGLFVFTLVAVTAMVVIPQRYLLTSDGILLNRSTFRTWSEFTGWNTRGNVIYLKTARRFGLVRLYLAGAERDRVIGVLRKRLPVGREV